MTLFFIGSAADKPVRCIPAVPPFIVLPFIMISVPVRPAPNTPTSVVLVSSGSRYIDHTIHQAVIGSRIGKINSPAIGAVDSRDGHRLVSDIAGTV